MADGSSTVSVPWVQVQKDPKCRTLCADFGFGREVRVIQSDKPRLGKFYRHLRILCESYDVSIEHPAPLTFFYQSDGGQVELGWSSIPESGAIRFGAEVKYLFRWDPGTGPCLTSLRGGEILRQGEVWDGQFPNMEVVWVSYLYDEDFEWPYLGIAAALLYVVDLGVADSAVLRLSF